MIDETHDPDLTSWVTAANAPDTDFPIQNLPFATFQRQGQEKRRVGVAIGDQILDLSSSFEVASLREVMALPRAERVDLRRRISRYLSQYSTGAKRFLVPQDQAALLLPCEIRNYSDFYASLDHATNVGMMLRPEQPLYPNYHWVPIAYHGRASSIVVSGSPVRRPMGQVKDAADDKPHYVASRRLDYEIEIGAFIGPGNSAGATIPIDSAEDHLFGVCLLNDWSARDIQAWEYQPLGPFLAKSFATSLSPWVVTAEALEPFRSVAPRHAELLPHLDPGMKPGAFEIRLEVWLKTSGMTEAVRVSHSNFAGMYWTLEQMITHHASNGCPLLPGDLIGSGTVSGPEKQNRGCLLELTWRGAEPLALPFGETRTFLEDGDEVTLRGWCEAPGRRRIGLGSCTGRVVPTY